MPSFVEFIIHDELQFAKRLTLFATPVDEFDDGLKAEFKTLFPGALEKLGYESNDDW